MAETTSELLLLVESSSNSFGFTQQIKPSSGSVWLLVLTVANQLGIRISDGCEAFVNVILVGPTRPYNRASIESDGAFTSLLRSGS